MISTTQIRMARTGLGLTLAELARRSGISTTSMQAIESGASDPRTSNSRNIQAALESAGAVFFSDGGVTLAPKGEDFIVEQQQSPDAETLARAKAIVAAAARSREPTGGLG